MSANVTSLAITMDHESGEQKISYIQFTLFLVDPMEYFIVINAS